MLLVCRADVIGMIEAIGDRSSSTARRTWVYTRRLFGWALSRDVYGLTASPCERIRVADLIGSPKPRERVLDADELRAIWQITANWNGAVLTRVASIDNDHSRLSIGLASIRNHISCIIG